MKKNSFAAGLLSCIFLPSITLAVSFGETGDGDSLMVHSGNRLTLGQFDCPADGFINRFHLRGAPYSLPTDVQVAVYDNAGPNQPGNLLAESASQSMSAGYSWYTFDIPLTAVIGGETYWLAYNANNTTNINAYHSDPNPSKLVSCGGQAYGSFPPEISSTPVNYWAYRLCAYVDSVPTATPSITPTHTQTPTQTSTMTWTHTPTVTQTPTITLTATQSATYTVTPTVTITPTMTATITATMTFTSTATATISLTSTQTPTQTTTQTVTATLESINTFGRVVLAYPNPARDRVNFAFQEMGVEEVKIEIYNINGERVAQIHEKQPGQTVVWEIEDLAPGIYIYRTVIKINGEKNDLGLNKIAVIR